MGLVKPLGELVQTAGESSTDCCKTQLVPVSGVHEIVALPGVAGAMVNVGAPGVWIIVGNAQKPPVTEYCPLVMVGPASGWPIVPLKE